MSAPTTTPPAGPYADQAMRYHRAGWAPLPLPPRTKKPVPNGWTGRDGAWPSGADIFAWTDERPESNLALRLPPHIVGIDVDAYDDKPGGLVLTQLEQQLGDLPPTWRSTSRDDGTSGIRLYQAPPGRRWPSVLGPGIEVIRHEHRYTVAWPSTHPTGGTYRWITPDGATSLEQIPTPDELPHLPAAWVEHFAPEAATTQTRAGLDHHAAHTWLLDRGAGVPCRHMERAVTDALTALDAGASRHDAALAATNRIAWLTGQGHTGGAAATDTIGGAFITATGRDRAPGEAQAELDRMIAGAIDLAAAAHPTTQPDPCDDPFAGLIAPPTAPQEQPCPPPAPTTSTASTPAAAAPASTAASTAAYAPAAEPLSPPAAATTTAPATSAADEPAPERTSWWPRDLDAALGNTDPEPPPAHLTRGDGHAAFYRGRVNGLIGPSESGKTWVALHAVHQTLDLDQAVTYIDFEDSEKGIVGRLLTLGAHPDQLLEHFRYIGPDEPFHRFLPTGIDLHEHLEQHQPELVILDGVNAAMTLQGLDLNSNKDATTFAQQILKPLTVRDTTVVYIDHTPKDSENTSKGGIGAQAKRAMTSGCTLRVDAVKPFGKGQDGRLRIHVDKDRQGDVRGISAPSKGTHWFGDFTLTHNPAESTVDASLDAPEGFDPDQPAQPTTFRPTGYMEKVSRYIQDHPGVGRNEIVDAVPGNDKHIKTALRVLVEEGWVTVEKGARNKSLHTLDTPFNELLSPPTNDRGPTGGHTGGQPPVETTGGSGGRDRDVVPSHPDPSHQLLDPTHTTEGSGPQSHLVERIVAGRRVLYDPTTNQTVDIHTGEVDNP